MRVLVLYALCGLLLLVSPSCSTNPLVYVQVLSKPEVSVGRRWINDGGERRRDGVSLSAPSLTSGDLESSTTLTTEDAIQSLSVDDVGSTNSGQDIPETTSTSSLSSSSNIPSPPLPSPPTDFPSLTLPLPTLPTSTTLTDNTSSLPTLPPNPLPTGNTISHKIFPITTLTSKTLVPQSDTDTDTLEAPTHIQIPHGPAPAPTSTSSSDVGVSGDEDDGGDGRKGKPAGPNWSGQLGTLQSIGCQAAGGAAGGCPSTMLVQPSYLRTRIPEGTTPLTAIVQALPTIFTSSNLESTFTSTSTQIELSTFIVDANIPGSSTVSVITETIPTTLTLISQGTTSTATSTITTTATLQVVPYVNSELTILSDRITTDVQTINHTLVLTSLGTEVVTTVLESQTPPTQLQASSALTIGGVHLRQIPLLLSLSVSLVLLLGLISYLS